MEAGEEVLLAGASHVEQKAVAPEAPSPPSTAQPGTFLPQDDQATCRGPAQPLVTPGTHWLPPSLSLLPLPSAHSACGAARTLPGRSQAGHLTLPQPQLLHVQAGHQPLRGRGKRTCVLHMDCEALGCHRHQPQWYTQLPPAGQLQRARVEGPQRRAGSAVWWTLTKASFRGSQGCMGVGVGPGKELEKTARAAPGTGHGDSVVMGEIRRQRRSGVCRLA
ncbi:hypothetical protein P7K49_036975, partial [Saguinus oedipus]